MKAKALILLLALVAATAAAAHARRQQSQTLAAPPDASGVAVVNFSWDKERVNWERDPFGGPVENFDEMRVRARNEKRIDDAKRGGSPDVDRIKREARADSAILQTARQKGPPRYGFRYKLSVRNGGAKAVREIDWDYVFTDAATHEELGRHQFTSAERVGPGKGREFSFFIPTPPALRVSAYDLSRKERDSLEERVVLVRVLYDDGTEWRRP
ncbi:MAG: hypothetical protein QOH49_2568 [Acidobacteriota bacterium]|jgi:hypothetical protein|nr:hypothetical protein [Acidobacteriota bacterium]